MPTYDLLQVTAWVAKDKTFPEELMQRLADVLNIQIHLTSDLPGNGEVVLVEGTSALEFMRQAMRQHQFPKAVLVLDMEILTRSTKGVVLQQIDGWPLFFEKRIFLSWDSDVTLGPIIETSQRNDYPQLRRALEEV